MCILIQSVTTHSTTSQHSVPPLIMALILLRSTVVHKTTVGKIKILQKTGCWGSNERAINYVLESAYSFLKYHFLNDIDGH